MNSKPLTYDSLKTVILYINPNTRFLLSSRIPSIQTAEKAVPLIINVLYFGEERHHFKVNETVYHYGIYQVDCKDKVPYRVSGQRDLNRKYTCDVDKFGIRDYINKADGWLPGNNGRPEYNLFGFNDREIISTKEGRLKKLEGMLKIEKQRLNQLMNYRPENSLVSEQDDEQSGIPDFKFICYESVRKYNKKELRTLKSEKVVREVIEYTNYRIRQMENELLPFENQKNNVRPEFEIHLNKSQEDGSCNVIERVKYTGDLHKAEESLINCVYIWMKPSAVLTIEYSRVERLFVYFKMTVWPLEKFL
uniref:SEP domain-containing protein n=1 Tax=Caenorhabditis tropicalis TaxID=1561998 RepID=A0A1I7UDS9_9PELO